MNNHPVAVASQPADPPPAGEPHSKGSLRQKTEAQFRMRESVSQEKLDSLSPESLRTILHEQRVHQIELEMQNEELHRTHEELGTSRAHYFDLYDLAPVGYVTISGAGLLLAANLTATTLLGVERRALLQKPLTRFIFPEDQNIFYRLINQPPEIGQCDLRMVKPDGTTFCAHLKKVSAQDENGEALCRIVLSDISWRKQAEELLREQEAHLAAILEAAADGILAVDTKGKVIRASRRFSEIWRIPEPLMESGDDKALLDFVLTQLNDPDGFLKKVQELYDSDTESFDTLTFKDGRFIELYSFAMIMDGTRIGRVWSFRDVTEEKKAEREIRRLNETLDQRVRERTAELQLERGKVSAAFENMEIGVVISNPQGGEIVMNSAALRMHGFASREDQNAHIGDYASAWELQDATGRVLPFSEWPLPRAIAGDFCRDWVVHLHNLKSQHERDFCYTSMPVRNEAGDVSLLVLTISDITERKEMDAILLDALARAEAGSRAKDEFLGVMSHELRTPLNGVLGFAELLIYSPLDSEQKDYVKTISKSGEHLLAIIGDILDFSSIEKNALAIQVAPMAVADLVKSAEDTVRKTAAEKGLKLRAEVTAGVPEQITSDERRIRQILINLLGNAVKFTASGSVVLRVAPDAEGRFLDFSVEDTGIGISSETLSNLFQPFAQADSTRTRSFGGTGLGLAISKRIAEAVGGSITVVSTQGKGSTFTFRLPLETSAPASSDPATAVPIKPGPIANQGSLVLVVDDDMNSSTLAGKMLQSLGYRAEFAADGAEALKAFVPGKSFAILMDVSMPVMGGLEATKKIREIEATAGSHVPIIALTANVMPGDHERCLAAGMDDFLSKPFKREELAAILASVAQ